MATEVYELTKDSITGVQTGTLLPDYNTANGLCKLDGSGLVPVANLPTSSVPSISALEITPITPITARGQLVGFSGNTTMLLYESFIPAPITVSTITIATWSTITVAWTANIACFTEDWSTKLFEVTTASLASTGTYYTTSLVSPVNLSAWIYYFAFLPIWTTNIKLSWATSIIQTVKTWARYFTWVLTVTANTIPSSFTPTNATSSSRVPQCRLN